MFRIELNGDERDQSWADSIEKEEKRAALALINKLAEGAKDAIISDLPRKFTLRSPRLHKGIRFDRGSIDNLEARVYSLDEYLWKQEFGEQYVPEGHVAIPSAARPSPRSLIPRDMLPKSLRNRPGVFKMELRSDGKGLIGIFQRVMNGRKLRVLYWLKTSKKTPARWGFEASVGERVDAEIS